MGQKNKRYKKGHFIGLGMVLGIPLGIPIGLAIGSIAIGPAIGVAIGLAIGAAMEQKYNKNPIELAPDEMRKQKKWGAIFAGIGLVIFIILVSLFFLTRNSI